MRATNWSRLVRRWCDHPGRQSDERPLLACWRPDGRGRGRSTRQVGLFSLSGRVSKLVKIREAEGGKRDPSIRERDKGMGPGQGNDASMPEKKRACQSRKCYRGPFRLIGLSLSGGIKKVDRVEWVIRF